MNHGRTESGSICRSGFVTNLKIGRHEALDGIGSRNSGYSLSLLTKSFVSSVAMLGRDDQVAAGVEGVVDSGIGTPLVRDYRSRGKPFRFNSLRISFRTAFVSRSAVRTGLPTDELARRRPRCPV